MTAVVKYRWWLWHRKIGFRFDNLSIMLISDVTGKELHEFDQIPKSEYMAIWYYTAYWSYQIDRNRRRTKSQEDIKKIIARMTTSEYSKVAQAANEAMIQHNKTIGETGTGEKKK